MDDVIQIPKHTMLELLKNDKAEFYDSKNYRTLKVVVADYDYTEVSNVDETDLLRIRREDFATLFFDHLFTNDRIFISIAKT